MIAEAQLGASIRRYRRLAHSCSALLVLLVTTYRIHAVGIARHPGHADPAFYYNVAENLAAGRGASVNYVWQFLGGFPPLHHYAFDYWLPAPSILMAAGLTVHHSVAAELDVNVAMSVLFALGTYLLGRLLSPTWWVAPAATAIVILQPNVSAGPCRTQDVALPAAAHRRAAPPPLPSARPPSTTCSSTPASMATNDIHCGLPLGGHAEGPWILPGPVRSPASDPVWLRVGGGGSRPRIRPRTHVISQERGRLRVSAVLGSGKSDTLTAPSGGMNRFPP